MMWVAGWCSVGGVWVCGVVEWSEWCSGVVARCVMW